MNLKDYQTFDPTDANRTPFSGVGLNAALMNGVPFRLDSVVKDSSPKTMSIGATWSGENSLNQSSPAKLISEFQNSVKKQISSAAKNDAKGKKSKKKRIVFFVVHGLEASSFDMRYVRAAILANVPNSMVYMVQDNTELTNDPIEAQGRRLAAEIVDLLKSHTVPGRPNQRNRRIRLRGALTGRPRHSRRHPPLAIPAGSAGGVRESEHASSRVRVEAIAGQDW